MRRRHEAVHSQRTKKWDPQSSLFHAWDALISHIYPRHFRWLAAGALFIINPPNLLLSECGMTFYYLLQDVSARKVMCKKPYVRVHRYVVLSSHTSELRTAPRPTVIGRHISAQPLGNLLRLFGAERDGGRRFISRSPNGRGSALWVSFLLRRVVGTCGVLA